MNYSVQLSQILLFACDLVIDAETCCHHVTLNKINIYNTGCVLTCESLLLICTPMVCLVLCCCVGWFRYLRFLRRIAILLEGVDIWRVEATSEKKCHQRISMRFLLLIAVCVAVQFGGKNQRFRETCCLSVQSRLKMEARMFVRNVGVVSVTIYGTVFPKGIIFVREMYPLTQFVNRIVDGVALHTAVDVR